MSSLATQTTDFQHRTVLMTESLEMMSPKDGGSYADVTLGGGGHAEALLDASGPSSRLVGVDRDPIALAAARVRLARFGNRVTFVHERMGRLSEVLTQLNAGKLDGLIADLGVSSPQLDTAKRGFSFREEGPLDMRMDASSGATALEIIDALSESELANVIYEYGEERRSRAIAKSIKRAREDGELVSTRDLTRAVHRVTGPRKGRPVEPATRTFQALRIHTNDELGELRALCEQIPSVVSDLGVVAIISFHSLEDRIVKHHFRDHERLLPLTKKPIVAGEQERDENPRSRSAKLRAARIVPENSSKKKGHNK